MQVEPVDNILSKPTPDSHSSQVLSKQIAALTSGSVFSPGRITTRFPFLLASKNRLLIQQIAPRHQSFLSCLPGARSPQSPTPQPRPLSSYHLFIFGARPFTKPTNSSPQLYLLFLATPPLNAGRGLLSREGKEEEEALGTPPWHKQITACDTSRHTCNVHFTEQPS